MNNNLNPQEMQVARQRQEMMQREQNQKMMQQMQQQQMQQMQQQPQMQQMQQQPNNSQQIGNGYGMMERDVQAKVKGIVETKVEYEVAMSGTGKKVWHELYNLCHHNKPRADHFFKMWMLNNRYDRERAARLFNSVHLTPMSKEMLTNKQSRAQWINTTFQALVNLNDLLEDEGVYLKGNKHFNSLMLKYPSAPVIGFSEHSVFKNGLPTTISFMPGRLNSKGMFETAANALVSVCLPNHTSKDKSPLESKKNIWTNEKDFRPSLENVNSYENEDDLIKKCSKKKQVRDQIDYGNDEDQITNMYAVGSTSRLYPTLKRVFGNQFFNNQKNEYLLREEDINKVAAKLIAANPTKGFSTSTSKLRVRIRPQDEIIAADSNIESSQSNTSFFSDNFEVKNEISAPVSISKHIEANMGSKIRSLPTDKKLKMKHNVHVEASICVVLPHDFNQNELDY